MPAEPVAELDERYGEPGAEATAWSQAAARLADAGIAWLSTVRPDGRPHVTPLVTVWHEAALWFATGPDERKALNLRTNPHVVLTTGVNRLGRGLDVVVEGDAVRCADEAVLADVAAAFVEKYGDGWHFDVADGAFMHHGHVAHVFRVAPVTAFGFCRDPYSQTRYRF